MEPHKITTGTEAVDRLEKIDLSRVKGAIDGKIVEEWLARVSSVRNYTEEGRTRGSASVERRFVVDVG